MHLIREKTIPCVMGNHDRDTASVIQPMMRETMDITDPEVAERFLSKETLDYLRQLPSTLTLTHQWMRILIAHGTPESKDEYLFPKSPSIKFHMIASSVDADVILLGHTHEPMQVKLRTMGKWFFNPGSVYRDHRRGGSYTCATLTLPECKFAVFDLASGKEISVPLVRI